MVVVKEVPEYSAFDVASVMGPEGHLVATRFARGCRCFGARVGGELVAYGWLSTANEWIGEVELEIRPGSNEGYIWNCATRPEHRRKGYFRAIVKAITAQARTEGLTRLWIGSEQIPAAKAIAQAGFAPSILFTSVWLSGMRWLRVRPADSVDPGLLMAAREVLSIGGRPLRLGASMKRAERRSH
jgi:GNAT superfamily N-acetyltransferase